MLGQVEQRQRKLGKMGLCISGEFPPVGASLQMKEERKL